VVPSEKQASILFGDMQDENVVVFKASKLSEKRGLVELTPNIDDFTDLKYFTDAFPSVADISFGQVPQCNSHLVGGLPALPQLD
jgi:hypothetical protein